ncbi:MAG: polymer-forming cytoskeletal protein [Bacteriovoracaceae bacterium]
MRSDQDFHDFNYNVLGSRSKIIGDVVLSGDAIITSEIHGSIEVQGPGKLVLERGSFVKGKIKAVDVEIFGTVEGEIECSGLVSVRSSAKIIGTLKSGRLVVYPGAVIETEISTENL